MHLTTSDTELPLCVVKGGNSKLNGEVIFIETEKAKNKKLKTRNENDVDLYEYVSHLKEKSQNRAVNILSRALATGTAPAEEEFADIYDKIISRDEVKQFDLVDGLCIPLADPVKRSNLYLFGQSGAGKSYFINLYVSEWKKLHKGKPVYLFSTLTEDESLDGLKPKRIIMDEDLLDPDNETTLESFDENSMVIFDDCFVKNPKIEKEVTRIKDLLLQTGRHRSIYMVISSHLGSNYRETRLTLAESHALVVFPLGCPKMSLDYILQNYAGLDKSDLKKLRRLPSRWVFIRKIFPTAICHEKGCYLL